MKVSGIDLAGVEVRPSGFCVLDERMHAEAFLLHTDEEIVAQVEKIKPAVVGIDAPLSLPRGRGSLEVPSPIHFRQCDIELGRMGVKAFPITLGPMRKLTKRGLELKEKLGSFKVIEVYPGGAQDVLGIPRKQRGLDALRRSLRSLGIKGLTPGMTGDELDAVTCALVAKLYLEGNYIALGDPAEGLMIMPKSLL